MKIVETIPTILVYHKQARQANPKELIRKLGKAGIKPASPLAFKL